MRAGCGGSGAKARGRLWGRHSLRPSALAHGRRCAGRSEQPGSRGRQPDPTPAHVPRRGCRRGGEGRELSYGLGSDRTDSPGGERRGESRAQGVDGGAAGTRGPATGLPARAAATAQRLERGQRGRGRLAESGARRRRPRRPGPTYRCEAQPETRPRRPRPAAAVPHFRFRSGRFRPRDRP